MFRVKSTETRGVVGECELACVMKLLPQGFDSQTDQRVGGSIRKENQKKTEWIKTNKHNWAS
jgi:hypothetical protein